MPSFIKDLCSLCPTLTAEPQYLSRSSHNTGSTNASTPSFCPFKEREIIADMKNQGHSIRAIARRLGRSPGTISKELTRHADDFGLYMPQHAQRMSVLETLPPEATQNRRQPSTGRGNLADAGTADVTRALLPGGCVSCTLITRLCGCVLKTIYQALFVQAKGELKQHIKACLRQGRAVRKPRRPKQNLAAVS